MRATGSPDLDQEQAGGDRLIHSLADQFRRPVPPRIDALLHRRPGTRPLALGRCVRTASEPCRS